MAMLRHLGTRPIHLFVINAAWGRRARHVRLSRCQDGAREISSACECSCSIRKPEPPCQNRSAPALALPHLWRIRSALEVDPLVEQVQLGDPVQFDVVVDVHDKNGAVAIPRHSKLYGRVTYVVPYEKKATSNAFIRRCPVLNGRVTAWHSVLRCLAPTP